MRDFIIFEQLPLLKRWALYLRGMLLMLPLTWLYIAGSAWQVFEINLWVAPHGNEWKSFTWGCFSFIVMLRLSFGFLHLVGSGKIEDELEPCKPSAWSLAGLVWSRMSACTAPVCGLAVLLKLGEFMPATGWVTNSNIVGLYVMGSHILGLACWFILSAAGQRVGLVADTGKLKNPYRVRFIRSRLSVCEVRMALARKAIEGVNLEDLESQVLDAHVLKKSARLKPKSARSSRL